MRGFRLSGWQRIGIVLSVVWLVVGGIWGIKLAVDPAWDFYRYCLDAPGADAQLRTPTKEVLLIG